MGLSRAPIKALPDREELLRLFDYDPSTGKLSWRSNPKFKGLACGRCGTIGKQGYLKVGINRVYFVVHRIIWKMITGNEPAEFIDHIDGDRLNNRFENLREATNGQNRWNSRLPKNNSSGFKGVCWDESHQSWAAYINAGEGHKRLGRFKDINDAISARVAAAENLHGQFMRVA